MVFNKEAYENNAVRGLMKRKIEHTKERKKHKKRHIPLKGVEVCHGRKGRRGRSASNGRGTAANHCHRCERRRHFNQRRRELTTAEGSKRVDLPQGLGKVVHGPRNGRRRANQTHVLRDTSQETVKESVAQLRRGSTMTSP